MPGIRSTALRAVVLLLAAAAAAQGQPQPQFEAEVVGDNVYALAGPGSHYYPTARLFSNEKVTVYGERSGDWLAILPPKSKSCSYIRASEVEVNQQDGSAKVSAPKADIRVGSDLTNNNAHWVRQVWLNRGTPIDIVEPVDFPGKEGVEKWYRIIPPEDEVRYVAASDLKLPDGVQLAPEAPRPAKQKESAQPAANKTSSEAPAVAAAPPPKVFGPDGTIPPATPVSGGRIASHSRSATGQAGGFDLSGAGSGEEALRRFDEELSRMTTRLPATWNLKELQAALDSLRKAGRGGGNPSLDSLQARLDDLATRKRRYDEITSQCEQARQEDAALVAEVRRVESKLTVLRPKYDAVGVLRPATLSLTGVDGRQAFSLTNDKGMVTHYVVPPAGLNLQQYVGKRIGLNGRREPRNGLPPLLWVEQVTPELDAATANVKTL